MDDSALLLFVVYVIVAVVLIWGSSRGSARTTPHDVASEPQAGNVQDDPAGDVKTVKVQQVIDGDTVVVSVFRREVRTRLYGIDCREDGQPWGNIATAGLIKLIGGRTVRMETHGLDHYGRTLATLYVRRDHGSEWTNVNERMVMLGHAWVNRRYYARLPRARQQQLDRLERWARSKRVGLWRNKRPLPPWRWRREQDCKAPDA